MRQLRVLPWLLVFALLAAQALGLMHRVVRAPAATGGDAWAVQQRDTPRPGDPAGHAHGSGWIAGLFEGHDDRSCPFFDPLNHEGAAPLATLLLPAALASHFLDHFQGEFLVRWAALFDARGPPALS